VTGTRTSRSPKAPDGALVVPYASVDPDALDALRRRESSGVRALYGEYGEYGNLVYVVAHRVLGRRDLAEEAAQQTFVSAWQAADRIDVGRDPAPWLATIAKRAAIDIHRREARRSASALGTVKSRSHRAHRKLATLLGHLRSSTND
jgi:DNA-directed RNA polymerase specialized sigma24 family protein